MEGPTERELSKFIRLNLNHASMRDEAKAIADVLILYKNFFPQTNITNDKLVLYSVSLVSSGYSLVEVNLAMERLVKSNKFFPVIAEIIEVIESIEKAVTGVGEKDFDEAWAEVYSEVRRCSMYKEPNFSTTAIADTVSYIGWATLVYMESGNVSTIRAQFERYYKVALKRKKERDANVWLLHQAGNDAVRQIAERTAQKRNLIAQLERASSEDSTPKDGTGDSEEDSQIRPALSGR